MATRRHCNRHSTLVTFTALLATSCLQVVRAVEPDFGFYPTEAQPCLERSAANTDCGGDSVVVLNNCFCSNTDSFVTNTAECLGRDEPDSLGEVYDTMNSACDDSSTPLAVSKRDFVQIGERAEERASASSSESSVSSTTNSVSSTASSLSEPSATDTGAAGDEDSEGDSDDNGENQDGDESETGAGGLSVGAKAGIGIGSVLGAAGLAGLAAFLWKRQRARKARAETKPMLSDAGDASSREDNSGAMMESGSGPGTAAAAAAGTMGAGAAAGYVSQQKHASQPQQHQPHHSWGAGTLRPSEPNSARPVSDMTAISNGASSPGPYGNPPAWRQPSTSPGLQAPSPYASSQPWSSPYEQPHHSPPTEYSGQFLSYQQQYGNVAEMSGDGAVQPRVHELPSGPGASYHHASQPAVHPIELPAGDGTFTSRNERTEH